MRRDYFLSMSKYGYILTGFLRCTATCVFRIVKSVQSQLFSIYDDFWKGYVKTVEFDK